MTASVSAAAVALLLLAATRVDSTANGGALYPRSAVAVAGFAAQTPNTPNPANPNWPKKGPPISPRLPPDAVVIRYAYDGGVHSQGRLCYLGPSKSDATAITGAEVLTALVEDGVDLDKFSASVYEMDATGGGWLPIPDSTSSCPPVDEEEADGVLDERTDVVLPLPPVKSGGATGDDDGADPVSAESSAADAVLAARRIDVKLFRRSNAHQCVDAALADQASVPSGKLPKSAGYFGVGVVGGKTEANVGTLWRSAYQMGAAFLLTVGARYGKQSTDTVKAATRIPHFELDEWSDFSNFAPSGVPYVAIEMGGTPLADFEHPTNAIYLLGSEDGGLPKTVLRACHEVVSIESTRYASYNVAVAGSIVLYDRMIKMGRGADADAAAEQKGQ